MRVFCLLKNWSWFDVRFMIFWPVDYFGIFNLGVKEGHLTTWRVTWPTLTNSDDFIFLVKMVLLLFKIYIYFSIFLFDLLPSLHTRFLLFCWRIEVNENVKFKCKCHGNNYLTSWFFLDIDIFFGYWCQGGVFEPQSYPLISLLHPGWGWWASGVLGTRMSHVPPVNGVKPV